MTTFGLVLWTRRLAFLAVAAVPFTPAAGDPFLVYDNGDPNFHQAYVSDPTWPMQYGDNFQLSASTDINAISWHGVYGPGDHLSDGDDRFSIRIFRMIGNSPESVPTVLLDTGAVDRQQTTYSLPSGFPWSPREWVYAYWADLPPVHLEAGEYLLSIINDTTGYTEQWAWAIQGTAAGSTCWLRDNDSQAWSGPYGTEFSFKIYAVPEPASLLLLSLAFAAGAVRRQGRVMCRQEDTH